MVDLGMQGVPPPPMMFLICCWLHCPEGAEGEVRGTMAITIINTTLAIPSRPLPRLSMVTTIVAGQHGPFMRQFHHVPFIRCSGIEGREVCLSASRADFTSGKQIE